MGLLETVLWAILSLACVIVLLDLLKPLFRRKPPDPPLPKRSGCHDGDTPDSSVNGRHRKRNEGPGSWKPDKKETR